MKTRAAAVNFAFSQGFNRPMSSLIIVLIRMLSGRIINPVVAAGIFAAIPGRMLESEAIAELDSCNLPVS